jgi:hypothetical protein
MKLKINILFAFLVGVNLITFSQIDYRRSSLTMVLLENDDLGKNKNLVIDAYNANPFPEKYNEHLISDKKFDTKQIKLNPSDYIASGFYKDTLKSTKDFLMAMKKPFNKIRYVKADSSLAVLEPSEKELTQIYLDKYIKDKNLAKQLVSTWFNRTPQGDMDWKLIQKRGMYSASAETKDNVKTAALPTELLLDFELIGNTYTVFNKLDFYENEVIARSIRDAAKSEAMKSLAGKPEIMITKTMEKLDQAYEKAKEGYTVTCNTYLYKLDWNDTTAQKVKDYLFNSNLDSKKVWDTTSIFKMKFIGKTFSSSIVTFKIGETRTEKEIIELQVKRTIDNALAKLQKEYVQFRPVSPITTTNPLTTRIGLKEGLEPGQKFEILEQSYNELGLPIWKSIGSATVSKKAPIWDNTQGAEVKLDENGKPFENPEFTTLEGGKNAVMGMHYLRLKK